MSNLVLTCKEGGDFKPHPEGVYPAVCVDVMDLGLVETDFQGVKKMVEKVKITFESEAKTEDGKPCTVFRSFSASLHPKSNLAAFLSKWRGRAVAPGESIELKKLIGASCTLVISHQINLSGKTYANIDAVSKPTRVVVPSGTYDPEVARKRFEEWKAKQQASAIGGTSNIQRSTPNVQPGTVPGTSAEPRPGISLQRGEGVKSGAAIPPPADFDPEVGF